MAKLNWERAAQRSRATAGMGFQELADAADDLWFEREMAREARVEESREARAKAKAAEVVDKPLTKVARRELRAAASALGVNLDKVDDRVQRRLFGSLGKEASAFRMDVAALGAAGSARSKRGTESMRS